MQNVESLNTARCIAADTTKSYGGAARQFFNAKVYPLGDGSNSVLIYQNRYELHTTDAYDWVVKYDVKNNRELWAYRTEVKYSSKSQTNGVVENYLTRAGFWSAYGERPECIHIISQTQFLDTFNGKATIRSLETGSPIAGSPFGVGGNKSCLTAQNGYIILWDQHGFLECYQNLKLKWKKLLEKKPDECCLHAQGWIVLFTTNSSYVRVYETYNGAVRHVRLWNTYVREWWSETESGLIMVSSDGLYKLDLRSGLFHYWVEFPKIHFPGVVIKTNKDYIVAQASVGSGIDYGCRYMVYNVSSGRRLGMIRHTQLNNEDAVGIGGHSVILPHLENDPKAVSDTVPIPPAFSHRPDTKEYTGILNIPGKAISYPNGLNIGAKDHLAPCGKNRVLCYGASSISIIG